MNYDRRRRATIVADFLSQVIAAVAQEIDCLKRQFAAASRQGVLVRCHLQIEPLVQLHGFSIGLHDLMAEVAARVTHVAI